MFKILKRKRCKHKWDTGIGEQTGVRNCTKCGIEQHLFYRRHGAIRYEWKTINRNFSLR